MNQYQILDTLVLGFLTAQDSYDRIIAPGEGHLQFDGRNIIFVDNSGVEHVSHTVNYAIEHWVKEGKIKHHFGVEE